MNEEPQPKKQGVIDTEHPYTGRIGDDALALKYKGVKIGLNGDYRAPMDLRTAIEEAGKAFIAYAEANHIDLSQYGFDINGDGKVGPREAGSGCAALALEHGKQDVRGKKDQVVSIYQDGRFEVLRPLKGENWRVAEQILGDTWPDEVKKPTNTPEADKAFLSRYSSGNDGLIR
ncbi:MAG: hypothetical protein M3N08_09015 [Pseudomonadota bacterium]|nr:hypothetical protein [Pseudomonadota bacterium]